MTKSVIEAINPLTGILKPQNNGLLYNNKVIGTLAVDEWSVTFWYSVEGPRRATARPGPSSLYQM